MTINFQTPETVEGRVLIKKFEDDTGGERDIYYLVSIFQRNGASAAPAKASGIHRCPAPVKTRPYLSCLFCRWGRSHGNILFIWKFIYCLFCGSCQLPDVLFLSLPIFPQDPGQRGMGRVYSVSLRVARDFCPLVSCYEGLYHTALLPAGGRV